MYPKFRLVDSASQTVRQFTNLRDAIEASLINPNSVVERQVGPREFEMVFIRFEGEGAAIGETVWWEHTPTVEAIAAAIPELEDEPGEEEVAALYRAAFLG